MPNEALLITGFGLKESRIVRGQGAFVIPALQTAESLNLQMITLSWEVKDVNTLTQVPLDVSGNVTIGIGADENMVRTAAQRLLGKSDEERDMDLLEPIKGEIRGLLGSMKPEDVSNNRLSFQQTVMESISEKLANFGMEVTSVQITAVSDKNGFIRSLYAEDVANREADAKIAQASADRKAREARAEQLTLANSAEQEAQRRIAEQEKATAIKQAEFKQEQDAKQGQADQAYALAQAQASQAVIEAEGLANTRKAEQEAIVAEKSVKIAQNKLEAEVIAKTNADAEAKKLEAAAQAQAVEITAKADAQKLTVIGNAQASAIKAEGLAKAETQEKMAEALEKNGEMLILQSFIQVLPEMAKHYADGISNIDKMTVFNGADGVNDMMNSSMVKTLQFAKDATGLDITEMMKQRAEGKVTLTGQNADINIKTED